MALNHVPFLPAKKITGTFSNPNNEVTATNGTVFTITYSDTAVTLKAK